MRPPDRPRPSVVHSIQFLRSKPHTEIGNNCVGIHNSVCDEWRFNRDHKLLIELVKRGEQPPSGQSFIGGDCKSKLKEFPRMKREVAIPVSIAVLSLAFFVPKVSQAMAPKSPPAPSSKTSFVSTKSDAVKLSVNGWIALAIEAQPDGRQEMN